jgi:hypothetical protein
METVVAMEALKFLFAGSIAITLLVKFVLLK